jgi:hypothetical protein
MEVWWKEIFNHLDSSKDQLILYQYDLNLTKLKICNSS